MAFAEAKWHMLRRDKQNVEFASEFSMLPRPKDVEGFKWQWLVHRLRKMTSDCLTSTLGAALVNKVDLPSI